MSEVTHSEHIRWAKKRALAYLDRGELLNACASMLSDLNKHPSTSLIERGAFGSALAFDGMKKANNGDSAGLRQWIEDFTE